MIRTLIHPNKALLQFACAALLVVSACAARAQTITPNLQIQISNTGIVTITATSFNASGNESGDNLNDGIDLYRFFTADTNNGQDPLATDSLSTLTTNGGGAFYDQAYGDTLNITNPIAALNLNLVSSNGGGDAQNFSTGSTAFTGTMTLDLSAYVNNLPTSGHGDIYSGANGFGSDTIVGTWRLSAIPYRSRPRGC